jgi:bacillopeptidase F
MDEQGNKSLSSKPIYIYYSNEKPILEINSPSDNQTIKGGDKKVTVSGKTNSDKEIVININGIMTIVGSDGSFSQNININEGDNNITITASDKTGNVTSESRKVIYQPS